MEGAYSDWRGHVIVCGLPGVGLRIVEQLTLSGVPAVVVDDNPVNCEVMLRQLGNFGLVAAILYPLLAVVFIAVFFASLGLAVRGQVRWKGRTIKLRGAGAGYRR